MKTQTYKDALKQVNIYYSDDPDTARAARSYLSMCQDDKIKPSQALQLVLDRFGRKSSGKNPADGVNTSGGSNLSCKQSKSSKASKTSVNSPKGPERSRNNPKSEILTAPDLERVEDSGALDMAEIERKVTQALEDFQQVYEIDDLVKAPQRQWAAASSYVGLHVFKGTDILKSKVLRDVGSATLTTCGAYDVARVAEVVEYYCFLCDRYDKVFFYDSGAAFCGLDSEYLQDHEQELTLSGFRLGQKQEQSLVQGIVDGKRSPLGSTVVLNHRFGYSSPAQAAPVQQKTVVIYPVLGSPTPTETEKLIDGNGNGATMGFQSQ